MRGTSSASGSLPRRLRRRSYAARLTNASKPNRTVSVSVSAPQAAFAEVKSSSSMFNVFFMDSLCHTKEPYVHGTSARQQFGTASQEDDVRNRDHVSCGPRQKRPC